MAYRVQDGDILRMALLTYANNQLGIITNHYTAVSHGGAGLSLNEIAEKFDDDLETVAALCMGEDSEYLGIKISAISVDPQPFPGIRENIHLGSVSSDTLPTQVSGIIRWTTDYTGPMYRGRNYVPFPYETANANDGLPEIAYLTKLSNLADAITGTKVYVVGANTTTLAHVIYHREDGTTTLVTGHREPQLWATQMRRGSLGKANLRIVS